MGSTTLLERRPRPGKAMARPATRPAVRPVEATRPLPERPDRTLAGPASAWQLIQTGPCREAGIAVLP